MTHTVIVNVPFFPGFYESDLSGALDIAQEREVEYNEERESSQEYHPDTFWPEELRLTGWQYGEPLSDCTDYSAAYEAMARDWCESFDNWAMENIDTPANTFVFESMTSPRFYNFETDRVFCTVPLAVMESLWQGIDRDKLQAVIERRHKSRSGFISFYDSDIESWLEKSPADMDHNELGTVLVAAMVQAVFDDDSDLQWQICEPILENDYEYLHKHCDWQKLESKLRELRVELLAKLIEENPGQAARYIGPYERVAELLPDALAECDSDTQAAWQEKADSRPYRCPVTIDMFAGESN